MEATRNARLARAADEAWKCRQYAKTIFGIKVGAAVLCEDGSVYGGCNIEHRYLTQTIHAEECALANMIAHGGRKPVAIVVVAQRQNFTPCGHCLDLIFEHAGSDCTVVVASHKGKKPREYSARELMPYYPSLSV